MSKKNPVGSPLASLVSILQAAGSLVIVGHTWWMFAPDSFQTEALPALRWLAMAAAVSALTFVMWSPHRARPQPTWEDWACGHYITGLPGSGKTAFAYLMIRKFCRHNWGWIWLSVKPSQSLLQYLPDEARVRCLLLAPYSEHPLGINLLQTYSDSSTERELIADQVAELFDRLHAAMSGNMREAIRMGTLALLHWASRNRVEVTLWELYRFFQEEGFRGRVLVGSPKPVRDAFSADEARKTTLQAVRTQLRRAVTNENLLVALSQRDGIDLWEVMQKGEWLVCDIPESLLGPEIAALLCQVIAARVQMLTSRRPAGSPPFGLFADEFQEYTNPSFAKGIATGREFGLAWTLIHQSRANQAIGKEVAGAVHLCGTRYYFQQAPEDARAAVEATEERWPKEVFTHLPARHFKALCRFRGRPTVVEGVTEELPIPDSTVARAVIQRSLAGQPRAQLLEAIQRRKVVGSIDSN